MELEPCKISSNCVLYNWEFDDVNNTFLKLIEIASEVPRVTVIENTSTYWHGICKSLIFRFPDDLEILKKNQINENKKGIIQIKSSSRYGLYDLGVNEKRIKFIYKKLTKKSPYKRAF